MPMLELIRQRTSLALLIILEPLLANTQHSSVASSMGGVVCEVGKIVSAGKALTIVESRVDIREQREPLSIFWRFHAAAI
jgi:hypothetical protein